MVVVTLGQQYNDVGEKPTIILYTLLIAMQAQHQKKQNRDNVVHIIHGSNYTIAWAINTKPLLIHGI